MEQAGRAWAAGFFDGEGYVKTIGGSLSVAISQRNRLPLDKWVEILGAGVVVAYSARYTYRGVTEYRPIYKVSLCGIKALMVIGQLLPYLVEKRESSESAVFSYISKARSRVTHKQRRRRMKFAKSLHTAGMTFTEIGRLLSISRQASHLLAKRA